MEKVSIVIPVYNAEKTLKMCLDSVINQTYKDIEIICINDASSDESEDIIKEYQKKDSRIIYFKQEKNQGPAIAKSLGINKSSGKYVMFVDSDDYINKDMVSKMYEYISSNKLDLVRCHYNNYVDGKLKNIDFKFDTKVLTKEEKNNFVKMLIDGTVPAYMQLIILNKDFIKNNKLELENQYFVEDLLFYIKILFKTDKVGIINENLYNYVNNTNGLTFSLKLDKIKKRINGLLYYNKEVKKYLDSDIDKQIVDDRCAFLLINFAYQLFVAKEKDELLKYLLNDKIINILTKSTKNNYDTFTNVSSKLILKKKYKCLLAWFKIVYTYIKLKRKFSK